MANPLYCGIDNKIFCFTARIKRLVDIFFSRISISIQNHRPFLPLVAIGRIKRAKHKIVEKSRKPHYNFNLLKKIDTMNKLIIILLYFSCLLLSGVLSMDEPFKVTQNKNGERVAGIEKILLDERYTLHFTNGRTKEAIGALARFDPDFHKAFRGGRNKCPDSWQSKEGDFWTAGRVYTKGREAEYKKAIENSKWTSIQSLAVYVPPGIEKIIRDAIYDNRFENVTHFSFQNCFSPLHFFGLRIDHCLPSAEWKAMPNIYFISDGMTTTPIAKIITNT